MRITREQLRAIIDHALAERPNECCGAVGVRDGRVTKVYPLVNTAASPMRFEIGIDMFHALEDMEDAGAQLGALYHSHPRTEPYPSQTDMNWSEQYPDAEWIIVGLGETEPKVRTFRVTRRDVEEVELEVE